MAFYSEEADFEFAQHLQKQENDRAEHFQRLEREMAAQTQEMKERSLRIIKERTERALAEIQGNRYFSASSQPDTDTTADAAPESDQNGTAESRHSPDPAPSDPSPSSPAVEEPDEAQAEDSEEEVGDEDAASDTNDPAVVDETVQELVNRGILPPSALGSNEHSSSSSVPDNSGDLPPRPNSPVAFGGAAPRRGSQGDARSVPQGRRGSLEGITADVNPRRQPSWENVVPVPSASSTASTLTSSNGSATRTDASRGRRPSLEGISVDVNPRRRPSWENGMAAISIGAANVTSASLSGSGSGDAVDATSTGRSAVGSNEGEPLPNSNQGQSTRQNYKLLIGNFDAGIHSLVPSEFNQDGVPSDWDMTLPYSSRHYQLGAVQPGDDVYEAACQDFIRAGLEVYSVERLQCIHQLDRFKSEVEHIKRIRESDFKLNVQYLYHGTNADKLRLCEEGLDARLGYQGCFGRGIYFSDHPVKCMQYADCSGSNSRGIILMCRVILGESKIYPKGMRDHELKREPEKEDFHTKGGWRFYDSVIGCPVNFNEFVVYENRRAMIEYIISFGKLGPITPSHPKAAVANALLGVPPPTIRVPMANGQQEFPEDDDYEQHINYIASIREEMKMKRAMERGIEYIPSSEEQRRRDRQIWNKRLLVHCPPNSPIYQGAFRDVNGLPPKPVRTVPSGSNAATTTSSTGTASTSAAPSVATGSSGTVTASAGGISSEPTLGGTDTWPGTEPSSGEEEEAVQHVMSSLIADFLAITNSDSVHMASHFLKTRNMDLDQAIMAYYDNM